MNKEVVSYLSDPCGLVVSLVEDAFDKSIDEVLTHWKDFRSMWKSCRISMAETNGICMMLGGVDVISSGK